MPTKMYFSSTLGLLVILLCSAVSASPLPTFNDIERRWSKGESEVCLSVLPACYVEAWYQDLRRVRLSRSSTHIVTPSASLE